ncbi:biotin--[acetyl-CoA-carboxylase] ligase [Mycolicibacterium sp. XJ1819]
MSVAELRAGLTGPGRPWRRLDVVDQTGSTNADLLARAAAGEDIGGAVLIAEHQTAGRGRVGRSWVDTPRAQIALSVGVDATTVPTDSWGLLPLATGVAVVDAVAAETGLRAHLKWPNDVLVGDAKLAGILAEVASPKPVIVVGVGLNVTLRPQVVGQPNATSLLELGLTDPDRDRLTHRLLLELARRIDAWRDAATQQTLVRDYLDRSATVGTQVRVMLPAGTEIVGTATSVDGQGRLIVEADGRTHVVSAGDVVHLRGL